MKTFIYSILIFSLIFTSSCHFPTKRNLRDLSSSKEHSTNGVYHSFADTLATCPQQTLLPNEASIRQFNTVFSKAIREKDDSCTAIYGLNLILFIKELIYSNNSELYQLYFSTLGSQFESKREIDIKKQRQCFYDQPLQKSKFDECESESLAQIIIFTSRNWVSLFLEDYDLQFESEKNGDSIVIAIGGAGLLLGLAGFRTFRSLSKASSQMGKQIGKNLFKITVRNNLRSTTRLLMRRPVFLGGSSGVGVGGNKASLQTGEGQEGEDTVEVDMSNFKAPIHFVEEKENINDIFRYGYRPGTQQILASLGFSVTTGLAGGYVGVKAFSWISKWFIHSKYFKGTSFKRFILNFFKPNLMKITGGVGFSLPIISYLINLYENHALKKQIEKIEKKITDTKTLLESEINEGKINNFSTYLLTQELTSYIHSLTILRLAPIYSHISSIRNQAIDGMMCGSMSMYYFKRYAPPVPRSTPTSQEFSKGTLDYLEENYKLQTSKLAPRLSELWQEPVEEIYNSALSKLRQEKAYIKNLFADRSDYLGLLNRLVDVERWADSFSQREKFLTSVQEDGKDITHNLNQLLRPIHKWSYELSQVKRPGSSKALIADETWRNYLDSLEKIIDYQGVFKGQEFPSKCYPNTNRYYFQTLKQDLRYASGSIKTEAKKILESLKTN